MTKTIIDYGDKTPITEPPDVAQLARHRWETLLHSAAKERGSRYDEVQQLFERRQVAAAHADYVTIRESDCECPPDGRWQCALCSAYERVMEWHRLQEAS